MPWKERTLTMTRKEFVERALTGKESISALCREFGISRPTGYKWIRRYQEGLGLEDQDRTPLHQPWRTPEGMVQKVLAVRDEHPTIGARKIARILINRGEEGVPSPSTINSILHHHDRITPEASRAATPYRRFEMEHPNDLWQMDYKGHFPLLNGVECHPLNIIDDHSRFCLCSRAMVNETFETFQPVMIELFQEFGMPQAFLSDNGNPWGSGMRNGFSRVDVWLMQLGILPMHGRILHPQTQGKCESYNRALTKELLQGRCFADQEAIQAALDGYRCFYNQERPHHALALDVPANQYEYSLRKYPGMIMEWEYPAGYRIIHVGQSGHFKYKGHQYYLGEAFHGEVVALRDSYLPGCVTLEYREFKIARIVVAEQRYDYKYPRRKQMIAEEAKLGTQ